jgi:hypothetical protein
MNIFIGTFSVVIYSAIVYCMLDYSMKVVNRYLKFLKRFYCLQMQIHNRIKMFFLIFVNVDRKIIYQSNNLL